MKKGTMAEKWGGIIMTHFQELEFSIFCIENVALRLGVSAEKVYRAFTDQSDILKEYILPEYEILHTQDKEYIVNDLLELLREKGVNI